MGCVVAAFPNAWAKEPNPGEYRPRKKTEPPTAIGTKCNVTQSDTIDMETTRAVKTVRVDEMTRIG